MERGEFHVKLSRLGAGNLVLRVEKVLESENLEDIYVFMDAVADNRETAGVYQKLRYLSMRNDYRIVVFPLVCSEFYFIQSIKNKTHLYSLYNSWCRGLQSMDTVERRDKYREIKVIK